MLEAIETGFTPTPARVISIKSTRLIAVDSQVVPICNFNYFITAWVDGSGIDGTVIFGTGRLVCNDPIIHPVRDLGFPVPSQCLLLMPIPERRFQNLGYSVKKLVGV